MRKQVGWCYRNRRLIPDKHHGLFRLDIETLCTKRSPQYLQQWVSTFQAHRDQALREVFGDDLQDEARESDSEGTFDTPDKDEDEYLVDITDGMDVDDSMAEAGHPTQEQHTQYITEPQTPGIQSNDNERGSFTEVRDKETLSYRTKQIDPKPPWK